MYDKSVTKVTTLPSTAGIADPQVRDFLDAMVNTWDLRNGYTKPDASDRFVTLGEIGALARSSMVQAFSSGVGSFLTRPGTGMAPDAREINDAIDSLADFIRRSILFQLLGTEVKPIDLQNLRNSIDAAIGEVGAAIIREQESRIDQNEAVVSTLTLLVARLGTAEGAITEERNIRISKDNALAQAINTIWANIGGNQAVIQDGSLAAVSPAAVQATRWTQVQAAAIDPNTGQPNSTIVRQELNSYASRVDGKMNSSYTVRAQIDVGGKTVVGGFGLMATNGAGTNEGPRIDFGVRADTFFIAATSATPNASIQIGQGNTIPFMVLTSYQNVYGVLYPPGVYIKKAVIGDATIGTAQIADATINSAKIQDAAITNAKIAGVIASSNFIQGSQGWYIDKNGYAEFNDVSIRRASLIASGTAFRSDQVYGTYNSSDSGGKGGVGTSYYTPGQYIRGPTFYIETGFTDFDAIVNPYAAGFYARIESPSNGAISGGPGSGNVYDLAFEAIAAPARTWGYIGSGTPGQRVVICVTPIIRVIQSFAIVTINNYTWALFRQR